MDDKLVRLHRVTANYESLQGLRLLPAALPVAYAGLGGFTDSVVHGFVGLAGFLVTAVLAVALAHVAGRWYERRYGTVRPTRQQRRRWALRSVAAVVSVAAAALLDAWLRPPVVLFGLMSAAVLTSYWHAYGGLRPYHKVGAAALVLASSLPLAGADTGTAWAVVFVTLAVVYALVGVLDHRALAAALPPARDAA